MSGKRTKIRKRLINKHETDTARKLLKSILLFKFKIRLYFCYIILFKKKKLIK